ncbi:MAG: deazaflavin-dependent oxidoreductase (nitroreductase family) [Nitriliruptoraceae bacterium]|jgi:deazaflavin-dependent oxidoreductase (nitroreductase family)
MHPLLLIFLWLVGTVVLLVLILTIGLRLKIGFVLDAVRRMNRRFMNPRQMSSAGQPDAYAAIVRHVGRTSGTPYETPVVVEPTPDGFAIALPYGIRSDWLLNVLAASHATIVHEGAEHHVTTPVLHVMTDVEHHFPAKDRTTHRVMGVTDALLVEHADSP